MSMTLDAPAATGTRIAELTRGGITLRFSVTDGQPWIALERWHKGETSCIAMPLSDDMIDWIKYRLTDVQWDELADWKELEP